MKTAGVVLGLALLCTGALGQTSYIHQVCVDGAIAAINYTLADKWTPPSKRQQGLGEFEAGIMTDIRLVDSFDNAHKGASKEAHAQRRELDTYRSAWYEPGETTAQRVKLCPYIQDCFERYSKEIKP